MSKSMSKRERLEALIDHYSNGNKSDFARMLGIKPQTINSWLSRDSYDIDLIYSICENLSADWLLTGEGKMLLDESINKVTQHVTGNNNTFAGRDLTTSTADLPELIAMTNQHQTTISELISTISNQQTTISNQQTMISELVNTISRQQQDISLLLGHKSDHN